MATRRNISTTKKAGKKHDTPRSRHAKPGAIIEVKGRAHKSHKGNHPEGSRPVEWALEEEW